MNWKHIQLIFTREMSDQLRDRRTLFTITVLPILLYPLIGLLMMQVAQFNRESPVNIQLVGAEHWPEDLPLLDAQGVLALNDANVQSLVDFEQQPWPNAQSREELLEQARERIAANEFDAILLVDPAFKDRLNSRIARTNEPSQTQLEEGDSDIGLTFVANLARDHSQIAQRKLETILDAWGDAWAGSHLADAGISPSIMNRIQPIQVDTSPPSVRKALLWSKVLPFVMLIWALTGAFYPAIDLCAGEKERGTLETLLSSPARRREIVWGKLGAVSVFSIASALLNLLSMHFTAGFIIKQLASQGTPQLAEALGPMPFHALGWLLLLLLPMSALFSALALAVAALARSTKEGQYYLMPLLLITLPLVALPMLPSLDLNIGTSLVPVSGAIFLVRALIEGEYTQAVTHLPFVLFITAACCWMSIRWAIKQFESEAVMFSETERWNLKLWLRHLWRERANTASPNEAVMCGVIILIGMFFAQFMAGSKVGGWNSIVTSTVTIQLGIILTPCLLMSIFLTRSLRQALRLNGVHPTHLAAAILLGICMHPSYLILVEAIQEVYTVGEGVRAMLLQVQGVIMSQPLWAVLLVLAALPAVCEELTFRGFILGGLLERQAVLRGIVISAIFFGFTHMVLQQSIAASLMGVFLGVIAWRTGGVVCTIIVHFINNMLGLTLAWCSVRTLAVPSSLQWAISESKEGWAYSSTWIAMSVMLAIALMFVIVRQAPNKNRVKRAAESV